MDTHLNSIRADADRILSLLSDDVDWTVRAPSCPEWTLAQLVTHLGGVHRMVIQAVRTGRGSHSSAHQPGGQPLPEWFAAGAAKVISVLSSDPLTPAWSFAPEGGTVGWWRRRQAMETVVHRVDVEQALGAASLVDLALAGDGISEVVEVLVPLRVAEGDLSMPGSLTLVATDSGRQWSLGSGDEVGTTHGTAADIFLALWKRGSVSRLALTGDAAALLRLPLVP